MDGSNEQSRRFWRSLDELAQTPEFIERLHREFPIAASEWLEDLDSTAKNDGLSRRHFLTVMGAGLGLMGLTSVSGCTTRKPDEKIVPYVIQPEQIVPGKPIFYATALNVNGAAQGVIVESHEGRPTKIEGNPKHPASLGATNVFMQASILGLYDPDRSQVVAQQGGSSVGTWDKFQTALAPTLAAKLQSGGRGMRILSEPIISPTLAAQTQALKRRFPNLKWHVFSPTDRGNVREGTKLALGGKPHNVVYALDKADVVVALDSDFLIDEPGSLRYARHFIDRRRVRKDRPQMNRLYVIESARTITGAMADHRLPTTPDAIEAVARAIAAGLGADGATAGPLPPNVSQAFIDAVVADLKRAGTAALVIPGEYQPPAVHALCHAINTTLGAAGSTVLYTDPIDTGSVDSNASLAELARDMNAGEVDLLFMLGGNPVYNAPADVEFAKAFEKVATRVHLGLYEDETSFLCQWHLPQTHPLEEWSDLRAFDGTVTIAQPLIAPLYEGRSVHEVLGFLLAEGTRSGYEIVRGNWMQTVKNDFEHWWEKSLHDGIVAGTALERQNVTASLTSRSTAATTQSAGAGYRVVFRPDPCVGDGAWANNAWLQELPKPISKLTWDNAAIVSVATARKLGVEGGSLVTLGYQGRALKDVPVLIVPGQPDDVVAIHFGYGRTHVGVVGKGLGFNAYALRTSDAPWFGADLKITRQDDTYPLAVTQEHQLMHGRDIVRVSDVESFRRKHESHEPAEAHPAKSIPLTLYDPNAWKYDSGNKWGMVIDQTACIGCNACVVACQSENNIPTVGKEQVIRNREMHWLRIDTYFASDEKDPNQPTENPETYFQPMLCQHCENAPCEVVCPVGATTHSAEGLNEMTYNRCVGTRYCSNNCPYKVRRFNYFEYNGEISETQAMQKNPNVTVRKRGVMEKCSFCVQRISRARIEAKMENQPFGAVKDGEVLTACQQSCPTQAIAFGNLNDHNSQVAKLRDEPTNYGLLTELNTEPRTTYLERLRNPNPAMKS